MAELLALAIDASVGAAVVSESGDSEFIPATEVPQRLADLESSGVRWVWWNKQSAAAMIAADIRPARCWDLAATHRLLAGEWRCDPDRVWAAAHQLDPAHIPTQAPVDLFSVDDDDGDPEQVVRDDGYLRADWVDGEWARSAARLTAWARCAASVQQRQQSLLEARSESDSAAHARHRATVMSESAAEIICAELEADGLPFDRATGDAIIEGFVGRRPQNVLDEQQLLAELDQSVLTHLPPETSFDLRSPDQVKSLLRRVGIEVPDTRAWRLEQLRDAHPIIEPLLDWRRAERIRTTFGYSWVDEHVGSDGRLRGRWSGSDGAAGRMTATAGLHNMPAEMRPAIAAEAGHLFVRADLGQIEPRILAAVSGDDMLAKATLDDDMYAPVAARLRVTRDIAKVAVLGAMYGQTTGKGAEALAGLEREYPIAMNHLRSADEAAQGGHDLYTFGGRRIALSGNVSHEMSERDMRSRAAARGRFGRNAIVQGAAAEFFKTWAALVRARGERLGARIVLCLHDELVVHTPTDHADATAALLDTCLDEAAHRWLSHAPAQVRFVRFVSDTSVVARWSEAK